MLYARWIDNEHCVVNTDIEYNIASYDKILNKT